MSKQVVESLCLNLESMQRLNDQVEKLASNGVNVSREHSGELNFSGCRSGYCQAWD